MAAWTLDPQHFEVGFRVKHMMVASVKGEFSDVTADVEIDVEQPERSSVVAVIKTASLSTRNEQRDQHLRSPDFLDAERYPELTFRSTEVTRTGSQTFRLVGDLTVRDVTRPVVLSGEVEGPIAGMDGSERLGFTATGEFDRETFGLTWNVPLESGGILVGRDVKLTLEGELIAAGASEGETAELAPSVA